MPKKSHFIPDINGNVIWKSNGIFFKGKVVVEFAPLIMIDGVVAIC